MIPVQNIYYMLSYAFQALQAQNYKDLATENFIIPLNYVQPFLIRALAYS